MDNMEFNANDFPSLFGSNGLFKDGFNKIKEKFISINEEAKDVQEEYKKLKSEVKVWMNRKSQIELAQTNIKHSYPSEVPPESKKDDKTYQERYAIAQEFISCWKTCIEEFEDYQKKCDELEKHFEETLKNKDNIIKTLSQISKLCRPSLSGGCFHFRFIVLNHPFITLKAEVVVTLIFSRKNIFIEISVNLSIYQNDVTETGNKIKEYRKLLDKTALKLNRIRMARTPAYSNQAQQCSVCNRPYVFLKWCKFCDIEQFKNQFSNWESGNQEFDKIIRHSQLSIKYPNGFIQWIPYEKFANVEFVGYGGFATVYKANWVEGLGTWDYALGKRVQYPNTPVALKELRNSKNIGEKFLEEVDAYIKSSSSTVLRCYGISKNPVTDEYIMVFPYAHGGNLKNYMKKRLNWVNKLDVLRHILYGVVDIHKRGLVHRDLHPGNFLHYRRTISVSDLGLCRPVEDITLSDAVLGVLPFVAPEVLKGKPHTQASDVYSIGMIMWFITSGESPFYDRKYDEYLAREICENLRPKILEGTPPDYKELMQKCWDADPHKRPATEDLYQKVLFWLNEFNKNPLPDTILQFITNKPKSIDGARNSNVEHVSKPIKTQAIRDPNLEELAAKIKKDTNSDDDGGKSEDKVDEWNTIHVNDYQNWLYEVDIMHDSSQGNIASIVTNENPQLNYELPPTPLMPSTSENTIIGKESRLLCSYM
ncbi:hypothetical protein RclHR1_12430002 [Rhizophagus clarus]|uniref:Protein kinase domain-containing protein n=1 Tax=Rhizophagus clarus TaxID=94130 RepID=A0A2Z6Q799_9GLOM|nr:hypothetical protein RclHR1_12430002 [Rhizophagus clarus]